MPLTVPQFVLVFKNHMDQQELLQSLLQAGINSILSAPKSQPPTRPETPTSQLQTIEPSPTNPSPTPTSAQSDYFRPSKASTSAQIHSNSISNPNIFGTLNNLSLPSPPYTSYSTPPPSAPVAKNPLTHSTHVQTSKENSPQPIRKVERDQDLTKAYIEALLAKLQKDIQKHNYENFKLTNDNIKISINIIKDKQVRFDESLDSFNSKIDSFVSKINSFNSKIHTINRRFNESINTVSNNSSNSTCIKSFIIFLAFVIIGLATYIIYMHMMYKMYRI